MERLVDSRQRLGRYVPFLILLAAAFFLYAGSFGHQWTMDDHMVVARNPDIRSLGEFFANSYPGRPLREITYLLDYQLFGNEPAGYHFQNILWHGINAGLIVLLARALGGMALLPWLAGALFLVHPVNVEVVANISHRKDSLMLAFSLLALLCFVHSYRALPRWRWLVAGSMCLAIGLLGKETAVGVVLVVAGYDLWLAEPAKRLIFRRPWMAWTILGAGLAVMAAWCLTVWRTAAFRDAMLECLLRMDSADATLPTYLQFVSKSLAFLALKLVWPTGLAMEYVFPAPRGWLDPWVAGGLGVLVLSGVLLRCLRRQPVALVGILTMAGFWLPVSNLFWPASYFAADRYLYSVCAGFALLTAWAAARLCGERQKLLLAVSVPVVLLLAGLAWQQNRVWASELALYQQAVAVSPQSTTALMGLGTAHMNAGDLDAARPLLQQAAMKFNDSKALYLLALVCEKQGDGQCAVDYYRRFVRMNEAKYQQEVFAAKRQLLMRYGIMP